MACDHNCSSCQSKGTCSEQDLRFPANPGSNVKHVIAVVSGKGGVGKSTVTTMLALALSRAGKKVAILDADITGPSIPRAFGGDGPLAGNDDGMFPIESATGIKIMSANLLLPAEDEPVIWRGPMIAGVVRQFWSDTIWGDVDYMFVDMPPGTGDVPLTVFQSLPVEGCVVVTSPQQLVSMIVGKAVNMAQKMDIPVLGLVENMAYLKCPDCGKELPVFGKSTVKEVAARYGIDKTVSLPLESQVTELSDTGKIEMYKNDEVLAALRGLLSI